MKLYIIIEEKKRATSHPANTNINQNFHFIIQ